MSMLPPKLTYIVNLTMKGEGGLQNPVYVVYELPLSLIEDFEKILKRLKVN